MFKTKINVKQLETKCDAMFGVMVAQGVFGDLRGTSLANRAEHFKTAVVAHALADSRNYLELTYPSDVRILINITVSHKRAVFKQVRVFPHPTPSLAIDYPRLEENLERITTM